MLRKPVTFLRYYEYNFAFNKVLLKFISFKKGIQNEKGFGFIIDF